MRLTPSLLLLIAATGLSVAEARLNRRGREPATNAVPAAPEAEQAAAAAKFAKDTRENYDNELKDLAAHVVDLGGDKEEQEAAIDELAMGAGVGVPEEEIRHLPVRDLDRDENNVPMPTGRPSNAAGATGGISLDDIQKAAVVVKSHDRDDGISGSAAGGDRPVVVTKGNKDDVVEDLLRREREHRRRAAEAAAAVEAAMAAVATGPAGATGAADALEVESELESELVKEAAKAVATGATGATGAAVEEKKAAAEEAEEEAEEVEAAAELPAVKEEADKKQSAAEAALAEAADASAALDEELAGPAAAEKPAATGAGETPFDSRKDLPTGATGLEQEAAAEALASITATGGAMSESQSATAEVMQVIHSVLDGKEHTPLHVLTSELSKLQGNLQAALAEEGSTYRHALLTYKSQIAQVKAEAQRAEAAEASAMNCMKATTEEIERDEVLLANARRLSQVQVDTSALDGHIEALEGHTESLRKAQKDVAAMYDDAHGQVHAAHEKLEKAMEIVSAHHRVESFGSGVAPSGRVAAETEAALLEVAASHAEARAQIERSGVVGALRRAAGSEAGSQAALEPARAPTDLHSVMTRVHELLGSMTKAFASQKEQVMAMREAHHTMFETYIEEVGSHVDSFKAMRAEQVNAVEKAKRQVKSLEAAIEKTKDRQATCATKYQTAAATAKKASHELESLNANKAKADEEHSAAIASIKHQSDLAGKAVALIARALHSLPSHAKEAMGVAGSDGVAF